MVDFICVIPSSSVCAAVSVVHKCTTTCSFVEKTASVVVEWCDTSVNRLVFVHDWCTPLTPEFCLSLGMEALSLIKGDQIIVTSLRGSTMLLIIDAMKVNESEFADFCTILVKILQGCLYKSQLFDEIPSS